MKKTVVFPQHNNYNYKHTFHLFYCFHLLVDRLSHSDMQYSVSESTFFSYCFLLDAMEVSKSFLTIL